MSITSVSEGFDTADLKEAKVRRRIILKLALQEARNSKVGHYCLILACDVQPHRLRHAFFKTFFVGSKRRVRLNHAGPYNKLINIGMMS